MEIPRCENCGKILYARETYKDEKARFGIPRLNGLIFVYELEKEKF